MRNNRKPVQRDTAAVVLSRTQQAGIAVAVLAIAVQSLIWGWRESVITVTALCEAFYFVFVGFKVVLAAASYLPAKTGRGPLPARDDPDLPTFTIFLPNVKEKPHVLRALLEAMAALDYPQDKLQVMPLIEHWDTQSLQLYGIEPGGAEVLNLAPNVEVCVSVPGAPGTKPAACDFGLHRAWGDYTVIFDSEDSPDPKMLLKAVRDFRDAPPDVVCLQARLLFWNILEGQLRSKNWMAAFVTRMYFVEYVVHFEFVLRGMARIGLVPPLGGTSNIFVTRVLREIAISQEELVKGGIAPEVAALMTAAWDPWCVAEDADIAGWLARNGYSVAMIPDSWTLEEAPHGLAKSANQRARWGKGYAQAGAVQSRHPIRAAREMGLRPLFAYTLMTLGTPLSLMLNPLFWSLTITYLVTRSEFIHNLFPAPVFYMGFVSAILGNYVLFFLQVIACLSDREPGLVKYMFALGPWWVFTSYSMWKGVLELFVPRLRFHWHVTEHGIEDPHTARREIQRRHLLMTARKLEETRWYAQPE